MLDDPDVGLMGNIDVDIVDGIPAFVEQLLGGADEYPRRELEHLAAVHLQEAALAVREDPGAAAGVVELGPARPVGAELEAEEAALLDVLQHHGARAVAEEDERGAVAPVEDPAEDVAADHERPLGEP